MVTINDKVSLIVDVDQLFNLNDGDVYDVMDGDTYKLEMTYKKMLKIFKENINHEFIHIFTNEIMTLDEWMNWYESNSNDAKDITIFLRYAVYALTDDF